MQVVLTDEYAKAWQPSLAKLSYVSVLSYNTSGVGEMELREKVRATKRAVGLRSIRGLFGHGLPWHSHLLLQNTEVHSQVQVKPHTCLMGIYKYDVQAIGVV